jgi:hypothetical protein
LFTFTNDNEVMIMRVIRDGYAIGLQAQFVDILDAVIAAAEVDTEGGVCLTFRDPHYSTEHGGFHPVEIAIAPAGTLLYITDFAYVGAGPFAELVKELDFDCSLGLFQAMGREFPLAHGDGLFQMWQRNFCAYYRGGVYVVEVSGI